MFVLKLVEQYEQPAACVNCSEFIDEVLCVGFPAVYDAARSSYLCDRCAVGKAPVMLALLAVICAGTLYGHHESVGLPDADDMLEHLKDRLRDLHDLHFAEVYGECAPDSFKTSSGVQ